MSELDDYLERLEKAKTIDEVEAVLKDLSEATDVALGDAERSRIRLACERKLSTLAGGDSQKDSSFDRTIDEAGPRILEELETEKTTAEAMRAELDKPIDERVVQALELADEKQILAELQGRVIDRYFYSFQHGNRTVVGLSYAGVKAVARRMAGLGEPIDVVEVVKEETDDDWTVTVKAVDLKTQEHRFGMVREPKRLPSGAEDRYALQKALSKAQRNALRAFLPEEVIVEMYREWKENEEVLA